MMETMDTLDYRCAENPACEPATMYIVHWAISIVPMLVSVSEHMAMDIEVRMRP